MASVKIKFRPSTTDGGQGTLFYRVIHNRIARQQKTGYRLHADEWDSNLSEVVLPSADGNRKTYLSEIRNSVAADIRRFHKVIDTLEVSGHAYSADDVMAGFTADEPGNLLFGFMESVIARLKALGKARTRETYTTTLSSFKRFRKGGDLLLDDMDSDMMVAYEAYLKRNGVSPNTSSFYMRNLRAVYNRAVEKGLVEQKFPFKHVYTGVEKTAKRAIPLMAVRKIKELDLSSSPALDFARNMFLFSFYTRGMSFVDMAYLRKKDLNNGILSYRRRKTGQQLFIKWEKCMQEIADKYNTEYSTYLLPVISPESGVEERKQYINTAHNVNRALKVIGKRLEIPVPLTMYVARHCTACQLCVSACPNQVLRPSADLRKLMQPEMSYERGYCRPECTKCSEVCPTGAIRPIIKVDKSSVQIGHAVWVKKNCIPLTDGVQCGNCARHCPTGAIQMVPSIPEDKDSPKIPVINVERCIGCGACENLCPARPFSAIYVEGHERHRII